MKTFIVGSFVVLGALVMDAYAQHAGCAHGSAAGTSTSTSTTGTTTTGTGSVVTGSGTSSATNAVIQQLLQLAYQQQLQQYLQQQEVLAAQEEQEREQLVAERRARLIAQRGTTLSARLVAADKGATGMVTYHTSTTNGTTSTWLKVEVSGAPAYAALAVSVGEARVGQIFTDSKGSGILILASEPKGYIQQSLPANFPTEIAAGTDIRVGALSGTWRARSTT